MVVEYEHRPLYIKVADFLFLSHTHLGENEAVNVDLNATRPKIVRSVVLHPTNNVSTARHCTTANYGIGRLHATV